MDESTAADAQLPLIPDDLKTLYEIHEWRNASAVLTAAHPDVWEDIVGLLRRFRLNRSGIIAPGGGKSPVALLLDQGFYESGWKERSFQTAILVDERRIESPTHKVDCFKNRVAVELEWNNKDTFYDRDLNNFRLLFDLRVIDVGVIITRTSELQLLFNELGKGSSYGASTTHMRHLLTKVEGGGGGGCPILVFGITRSLYDPKA